MPISLADLDFAASLKELSDEDFMLAWHEEVFANDEPRIMDGGRERYPSLWLVHVAPSLRSSVSRPDALSPPPRRSGSGERLSVTVFIERRQWRPILRPRRIDRYGHLFRRNVAGDFHRLDQVACQP
jgi:hypothetical protein